MIRVATPADVDWMVSTAERVYPRFDRVQSTLWLRNIMREPQAVVLIDGQSAIIATVTQAFWGGPLRCYLLFAFGAPTPNRIWEVCRLMRAIDAWRKEKGAESFHFGEETGIDFEPIAKRIGAQVDRPSWKIEGGQKEMREAAPSPALYAALAGGRASALMQALGRA